MLEALGLAKNVKFQLFLYFALLLLSFLVLLTLRIKSTNGIKRERKRDDLANVKEMKKERFFLWLNKPEVAVQSFLTLVKGEKQKSNKKPFFGKNEINKFFSKFQNNLVHLHNLVLFYLQLFIFFYSFIFFINTCFLYLYVINYSQI